MLAESILEPVPLIQRAAEKSRSADGYIYMRRDFDALFPVCREVTQEYADTRSLAVRGWDCVLRLFSPLM